MKHLEELERIADGVGSSAGVCTASIPDLPMPEHRALDTSSAPPCRCQSSLGRTPPTCCNRTPVKVDLDFEDDEIKVGVSFESD